MSLTTEQKLDAIETAGCDIAFNGCHKLYFLLNPAEVTEARDYEYEIHPGSKLRELVQASCFLVFVHPWSLGHDHPWDIPQFELDDEEDED